jgi:hypothetical protein
MSHLLVLILWLFHPVPALDTPGGMVGMNAVQPAAVDYVRA